LFTEIPLDREARIELEGRFSGEDDAFYVGICRPCVGKEEVYRRVTYEECTFPERFSIKQGIWIPRVFEEAQARGFTR
jgi:hypothetical protein